MSCVLHDVPLVGPALDLPAPPGARLCSLCLKGITFVCMMCTDFGLAVFYTEAQLPRTDLGLEGTPWCAHPGVITASLS